MDINEDGNVIAVVTDRTFEAAAFAWNAAAMTWEQRGPSLDNAQCTLNNIATIWSNGDDDSRWLLIIGCVLQAFDYDPTANEWLPRGQPFDPTSDIRALSTDGMNLAIPGFYKQ